MTDPKAPRLSVAVLAVVIVVLLVAGVRYLTGHFDEPEPTQGPEAPSKAVEAACRQYNSVTVSRVSCGDLTSASYDACLRESATRLGRPWRDCARCGAARHVKDCPEKTR